MPNLYYTCLCIPFSPIQLVKHLHQIQTQAESKTDSELMQGAPMLLKAELQGRNFGAFSCSCSPIYYC